MDEIQKEDTTPPPPVTETKASTAGDFAKTATAAKLSGKLNQATGFIKRKVGEITDNPDLQKSGRDQELLGKVHSVVGDLRELRDYSLEKIHLIQTEGKVLAKKHGEKLLSQAVEFASDVKKTFFK